MSKPFKKILAREILIFFGLIGLTLFIGFGIWCYSLVIAKMIEGKKNSIQTNNDNIRELSKDYDSKFSKIKSFIGFLKTKEDENWGSGYSLYLMSKEIKFDKAVKKYEDEQSINGTLPRPEDTTAYIACMMPLKEIKLPKGYTLTDFPIDNVLVIWNCLITNKEHLFYLLPLPVLEEYKADTRDKLFKLVEQYQINKEDNANKAKASELQSQITQLEKERNNLSYKSLTRDDLMRIVKSICIILLVIVYPLRLIYFTFKWAIKNYRQQT